MKNSKKKDSNKIFQIGDRLTLRDRHIEVIGGDCIFFVEVRYDDGTEGVITSLKVSEQHKKKVEDEYNRKKLKNEPVLAKIKKPAALPEEDTCPKPEGYYVYFVKVDEKIVYIGQGTNTRYKHVNSGKSHNTELNRMFFQGVKMSVEIHEEGLSSAYSKSLEKTLIKEHQPSCNFQHNTVYQNSQ